MEMIGSTQVEGLTEVLTYIQAHIEDDLSLAKVSQIASLSPFHFHRRFNNAIGETLKRYTLRLRLERAAFYLTVQDASILEIALSMGFTSHETFTRAFRRQFGETPKQYRQSRGEAHRARLARKGQPEPFELLNKRAAKYQLSKVTIRRMNAIPVAFIRQHGPYAEVDPTAFDRLVRWLDRKKFSAAHPLLIGVGHDSPSTTPIDKLRFDACVSVDRPFRGEGDIGYQELPGGDFATSTYVGPYGPTMEQAYFEMFTAVQRLNSVEMIGLPAVEIYRTTQINIHYELNETELLLPVQRRGNHTP